MRPVDRTTIPVRVYRGDYALLSRTARNKTAEADKKVTVPDVIHELCKQLRDKERGQ